MITTTTPSIDSWISNANIMNSANMTDFYKTNGYSNYNLQNNWIDTGSGSYIDFAKALNANPTTNNNGDFWGKLGEGLGLANSGLQAINGVANLFTTIGSYSQNKALNEAKLQNLGLQNESLRFEIDNRKSEIERLNKIRTNVNNQMTNGSQVKTAY